MFGTLDEEVYITHPKIRYTVKKSPRLWNDTLNEYLNENNWFDSEYSSGLFVHQKKTSIIAVYIDACNITGKNEEDIDDLINIHEENFEFKIVGRMSKEKVVETDVLGIDLHYSLKDKKVELYFKSYIEENDETIPWVNWKGKKGYFYICIWI